MYRFYFYVVKLTLIANILIGQTSKFTVAVLDFEPRGITELEAATLTDRFTSELNNTDIMRLVERGMMAEILNEQGFQQSGCTSDECAVEVGALLGVQKMISGSVGLIGDTYTIDVKMVSIETGATEETRSVTYIGKVDGLVTEMELLAWDMMEKDPPEELLEKQRLGAEAFLAQQTKPKTRNGAMLRSLILPGFGQLYSGKIISSISFLGLEVAFIGMALNSQSSFNSLQSDQQGLISLYNSATSDEDIENYVDQLIKIDGDLQAANDQLKLFSSTAIGLWTLNVLHAFLTGPRKDDSVSSMPIYLVYDPKIKQTQLKWSFNF